MSDIKLTKKQKENANANYRKLWLKLKVDAPFMLYVTKMQAERGMSLQVKSNDYWETYTNYLNSLRAEDQKYIDSDEFKQLWPIIDKINALNLSEESKKTIVLNLYSNTPSLKFKQEIKSLLKFGFEDFWLQSLAVYIVTDKIVPPFENKSRNCPTARAIQDWKIFILSTHKDAQHSLLKKKGYKSKDIAKMTKAKLNDVLPYKIIHGNIDIAQKVFGDWYDDVLKDEELRKKGQQMENRIKKRYERFKKVFVDLTDKDMDLLNNLKFPPKKSE